MAALLAASGLGLQMMVGINPMKMDGRRLTS